MQKTEEQRLVEIICCIFVYKIMTEKITIYQLADIENELKKMISKTYIKREQFVLNVAESVGTCVGFVTALLGDSESHERVPSIKSFICNEYLDNDSAEDDSDYFSTEDVSNLAIFSICLFAKIIPVSEFSSLSNTIHLFKEDFDDVENIDSEIIRLISTIGYSILSGELNDDLIMNFFSKN